MKETIFLKENLPLARKTIRNCKNNILPIKIKACFFDFDGTLVDSMNIKGKAFADLFALPGSEMWNRIQEHHQTYGGMNRIEKIRYYYQMCNNHQPSSKEVYDLAKKFSRHVKRDVIRAPEISGASSFLEMIYKNSICYLLSATPQDELCDIVHERGWDRYFCGVYGYPLLKENILKQIIRGSSLKVQQCIYFGDALADYGVAHSTKIKYIMVSSRSEMGRYCAEHDIPIISDYAIFTKQ